MGKIFWIDILPDICTASSTDSTSLFIRKMPMNAVFRYNFTPTTTAVTDNNKYWWGWGETGTLALIHYWWVCKNSHFERQYGNFFKCYR